LIETARGDIVEWITDSGLDSVNLGGVTIARNEYHSVGVGLVDEVEESLTLQGEVAPLFETVTVGDDLNARGDDTEIGGRLQLFLEPGPLGLAQYSRRGIVFGKVGTFGSLAGFV
jgi:hypothetical protein